MLPRTSRTEEDGRKGEGKIVKWKEGIRPLTPSDLAWAIARVGNRSPVTLRDGKLTAGRAAYGSLLASIGASVPQPSPWEALWAWIQAKETLS